MSEPLIIDGKTVAAAVHARSLEQIAEIKEKYGTVPGLAVILVGENPASQVYVGTKVKKCGELGIYSEKIVLPEDTTQEQLLEIIDSLNKNPNIPVFLLSLKAGGVGLNLTSADTVIIYDPWWNPAAEAQATDRSHRIGQTKSVNCIKLIVKDSIEEKVLELQKRKAELFENLVETPTEAMRHITMEDLEFLLK